MRLPRYLDPVIAKAAADNNVDELYLRAILQHESRGDIRAVSPAGAQGIAQLMPATARGLGVTDALDPNQAIPAAARLLNELLSSAEAKGVKDPATYAAKAYNAGPRTGRWGNDETRAYPGYVAEQYRQLLGADGVPAPAPASPPAGPDLVQRAAERRNLDPHYLQATALSMPEFRTDDAAAVEDLAHRLGQHLGMAESARAQGWNIDPASHAVTAIHNGDPDAADRVADHYHALTWGDVGAPASLAVAPPSAYAGAAADPAQAALWARASTPEGYAALQREAAAGTSTRIPVERESLPLESPGDSRSSSSDARGDFSGRDDFALPAIPDSELGMPQMGGYAPHRLPGQAIALPADQAAAPTPPARVLSDAIVGRMQPDDVLGLVGRKDLTDADRAALTQRLDEMQQLQQQLEIPNAQLGGLY